MCGACKHLDSWGEFACPGVTRGLYEFAFALDGARSPLAPLLGLGDGLPIVARSQMTGAPEKKLCFVIGPIGSDDSEERVHADWLLKAIIEPVFACRNDYTVKRSDGDNRPVLIDVQKINDLVDSDICIDDLSFLNANAFYEIGIRHVTMKPIIHMHLKTTTLPFDVGNFRSIPFERRRVEDVEAAKRALANSVDAVQQEGFVQQNPYTNARGRITLEQNATPEIRLVMEQVDALKAGLSSLQTGVETLLQDKIESGRLLITSEALQESVKNFVRNNTNSGISGIASTNPYFVSGMTQSNSLIPSTILGSINSGMDSKEKNSGSAASIVAEAKKNKKR